MKNRGVGLFGAAIVLMFAMVTLAGGADWNEWRGPGRDGLIADSVPLLDSWPSQRLVRVWKNSEYVGDKCGYGSLAVAEGRVFCIVGASVTRKTQGAAPADYRTRDNTTICVDAATGKTLWKKSLPGGDGTYGPGCTPCVVNGKCYGVGEGRTIFCLDAATGEPVWTVEAGKGGERYCSLIVEDGVLVAPVEPLMGLDAATGKELWVNKAMGVAWSSPVRWVNGGRTNLIIRGCGRILCFDPKTGATIWTAEDNGNAHTGGSTPAVAGDTMVLTGQDVRLFKLSPQKAVLTATIGVRLGYSAGATVCDGHAYIFGDEGACIRLADGKLMWKDGALKACGYSTPVCADGKMFIGGFDAKKGGYGDGSLVMILPSPEKGKLLAKAGINQVLCTTPAIAGGFAYCRLNDGIACYDLRRREPTADGVK